MKYPWENNQIIGGHGFIKIDLGIRCVVYGGGGSSESSTKTETDQSTTITTNTTSNLSDLHLNQGFTGEDAVNFAKGIADSVSASIQKANDSVSPILNRQFDIAQLLTQGSIDTNKISTQLISRIHDGEELTQQNSKLPLILAGAGVLYATYKLVK